MSVLASVSKLYRQTTSVMCAPSLEDSGEVQNTRYETREKECFITFSNTKKRVENTTRSGVFLTNFRGVWKCDETLSRVFDISSQSKLAPRNKRRSNISNTREIVSSHFQTPRSLFKIRRATEYF